MSSQIESSLTSDASAWGECVMPARRGPHHVLVDVLLRKWEATRRNECGCHVLSDLWAEVSMSSSVHPGELYWQSCARDSRTVEQVQVAKLDFATWAHWALLL